MYNILFENESVYWVQRNYRMIGRPFPRSRTFPMLQTTTTSSTRNFPSLFLSLSLPFSRVIYGTHTHIDTGAQFRAGIRTISLSIYLPSTPSLLACSFSLAYSSRAAAEAAPSNSFSLSLLLLLFFFLPRSFLSRLRSRAEPWIILTAAARGKIARAGGHRANNATANYACVCVCVCICWYTYIYLYTRTYRYLRRGLLTRYSVAGEVSKWFFWGEDPLFGLKDDRESSTSDDGLWHARRESFVPRYTL